MAKLNTNSATSRRSIVIKLVDDGLIHSQNDLVKQLSKYGFVVTQATASRDLEELGAVRGKDNLGIFRYQFVSATENYRSKVLSDLVASIDSSMKLLGESK